MTAATAGQWLARTLAQSGVSHVFFVDAILRRTLVEMEQAGIRRVLAHTEKAAAYMADGYARVRGRPGICMAQSVGAANLAAGLQDAALAQSPVVAITGRKPLAFAHRHAYQELPHPPLFAAVARFSGDADRPQDLPRVLAQAWRAATAATPGPAHVDVDGLTGDRLEGGAIGAAPGWALPSAALPAHRAAAAPDEVAAAARRLLGADRVAIVAGTGAMMSGAGAEIRELARRLRAPVATSLGARGILPTRDPLAIGTVGSYSAPPANEIVHGAEVVLFVGCRAGDQVTLDWRIPPADTPVVQIDADPLEPGRNYPDTVAVCGDPRTVLRQLLDHCPAGARDGGFAALAAGRMAQWRAALEALAAADTPRIRPERLCLELARALPADGILVADTGHSSIWSCTCIELEDGQTYLRAAGSLGWAFPAAIGAKCAAGARPVVCFTGDGGFYYHLAELETARRLGLPVVVVINNNSGFGQSYRSIRAIQGDTPGHPDELCRFGPTDFAALAGVFGVRSLRVERAEDLAPALRDALAHDGPVVVDVVTDIEPHVPTPWKPA